MNNYRIFVEKKAKFRIEADSLKAELNENLSLDIKSLRLLNVYDVFGFSPQLLEKCRYSVFGEIVTDFVTEECDLGNSKYVAVEYLPGQFDQRASSALDCVHLIEPDADVVIKSSRLILLDETLSEDDLEKVRSYVINPVEARVKDLSKLVNVANPEPSPVELLEGFRALEDKDLESYCRSKSLAMNADDLAEVVKYFRHEDRDPNETELRILDTYWSDHCRHTTFTTEFTDIEIEEGFIHDEIKDSYELYLRLRKDLSRESKSLCLMDLATIGAKYLRKQGLLDDMEISEEINACSIYVDVDNGGNNERWLLMFKNETHNHPTEIEPFGGAATCLGGAIRDPLSGRSYVYQAMRITGAADICKSMDKTIPGKLPQRIISKKAAQGYSSYGNQIGLATTHVREIYHEGYEAKRLEIGAVVGAVKAEYVRRESPVAGDMILMLGGRTGRDGIGGATGSSKEHTETSIETSGSEVQKGNPPEERKLQRLFRRPEITRLIKKSNDFGAGGVSVAIGELADGLDIYLSRIPLKYSGLNNTEIAISESQERMSVVVEAKDVPEFSKYCAEENIELTHVADVTDNHRMRMFYGDKLVVDLSRDFINSAGAKHYAKAKIAAIEERNPFLLKKEESIKASIKSYLAKYNVASQKGLIEMFDSTIGRSTVLLPFGGKRQNVETQVSVQKLPTDKYTDTASIMAYGYDPELSLWSPYHGAAYAVVEACAKIVAAGASYEKMRFTYQEYFERMTNEKSWGKPLSALLGALKMQYDLSLPAIGGKDSMSGTFENINVPPTLVAFGITTVKASTVISPELEAKSKRQYLYLYRHSPMSSYMPNTEQLKTMWTEIHNNIVSSKIEAAYAIESAGLMEAIAKMSFGSDMSVDIKIDEQYLYEAIRGSILVSSNTKLDSNNAIYIGEAFSDEQAVLSINGEKIDIKELLKKNTETFSSVYPVMSKSQCDMKDFPINDKITYSTYKGVKIEHPRVFIPVFPGTNCDYDTAKAFRKEGAEVHFSVFRNLTDADVLDSIQQMRKEIDECHILALAGGFSAGDEPDGSGKFIANVLNNKDIADAVHRLIDRGGLILGICNGFQALVKSGLLPYGRLGLVTENSPTLFRNDINRHISQMVATKVRSVNSPWLAGMNIGDVFGIAVSHGEGKFVVNEDFAKELFANAQVAFQYVDIENEPTMDFPYNPNGSYYAIEGIISKNGQILGKMGHTERYEKGLFKNFNGLNLEQPLFANAVRYFRNGRA